MQGTFTTIRGNKIRSATKRRYILVYDDGVFVSTAKRSDNLDTLRKLNSGRAWWDSRYSIIDTTTGETVVSRILEKG